MSKVIKSLCCVLLLVLSSCGKGASGTIVLSTKEGVSEIKKIVEDQFGLDKDAYSLTISNKSLNSIEVEQVTVMLAEKGKSSMWFYSTLMNKLFKPESGVKETDNTKAVKLKDFNVDNILANYNKAIVLIEKETKEFNNYRLEGSYSMIVDQKTGKINESFNLFADKISTKENSFYGKRIEDSNVFKFSFKTDENGALVATEGLNVFEK
ncbi:hypothetical protein [Cellulophaga lytica]|uniref:Lipoprotein n=1 Tax=Cellulophaga lytica (strain ATCC 23178 / DSM 7489 / JCM 8516 / NBRC 14961 / NCIMB 1423 / VKM B-1433 / Cy l20) TaxID=867900 RepID=F0RFS5_CELLC|nr:hypothetical protein [Cellulophaga lytica]ADY30050.1 hypothetical protein Celly_2230 [Cellulophaga lytica DSM 7489]MDO6853536.1 hypothetical protein [Cellulophaga lytica]WQG75787.1 hypothetical protein SR888_08805 [Cellulophaga lytica]